jgi:hypothetical protein
MSELDGALLGGTVTGWACKSADLKLWMDLEGFMPKADLLLELLLPLLGWRCSSALGAAVVKG